jgi:hypothetical protein
MKTVLESIDCPYTRNDVCQAIKENGGKAKNLDLTGVVFEEGIDLSNLDLCGIILKSSIFRTKYVNGKPFGPMFNGSNLMEVNFYGAFITHARFDRLNDKHTILTAADLRNAQMQHASFYGADLSNANFQAVKNTNALVTSVGAADFRNAILYRTNFEGCDCIMAKFEGAHLRSCNITEALLEDVDWGEYTIAEETDHNYHDAEECYRKLKVWYKQSGYDGIAAKFYYREKEAYRKSLKLFSKSWNHRITMQLSYWVFGYGEGWKRILFWIAGFILFFAGIYFILDSLHIGTLKPDGFVNCLYYSAASFVALGYGAWIEESAGWIRGLGVFETFIGFFIMTLLLVTFVRKWTR